ncbi:outer membrane lipid asymmetry maintenance protein MlaD [Coxiella-like endosymbiont]|uniref:outer membrane lipid asymmetry maintenance protein MlaD n=1 Tax=Coxiella-like endosymbiont TaxID=1592897 RepID=UPI00272B41F7|nr:outer membrane lipid asymmetry maintenance protein MlaD [Coxiella-like endosymbiont]
MIEFMAGLFMIAGFLALIALAFKTSGLKSLGEENYYVIKTEFDNIGGLKVRAPVMISGVTVGQVMKITLDRNNFRALVVLQINKKINNLPADTSATILTQGLLGANYIELMPGFASVNLKNNDWIKTTHSALILENLIGQFIYNFKK